MAKAATAYENYLKFKGSDLETAYKLAGLMERLGDYPEAAYYYNKVANTRIKKTSGLDLFPRARFDHGRMLKAQGNYSEAHRTFEKVQSEYKAYNRAAVLEEVEQQVIGCLQAMELYQFPEQVSVLPITKAYSFGFPVHFGKRLLLLHNASYGWEMEKLTAVGPAEPLWITGAVGDSVLVDLDTLNNALPCDCEASNPLWDETGKLLYFTYCTRQQEKKAPEGKPAARINCKIATLKMVEGKGFEELTDLPEKINVDGAIATHPFLARQKNGSIVLYFASDRPGGFGGLDIWSSIYDPSTGLWSRAVNAGRNINSPFEEITPFYEVQTGNIYFSSDRRTGSGGFDIYRSVRGDQATVLPPPFNSPANDFYYMLESDGTGYLTSTRLHPEKRALGGYRQVFRFQGEDPLIPVRISALKSTNHKVLKNTVVTLYGLEPETGETYLFSTDTIKERKSITLQLPPDQTFKMIVQGPGFFKHSDLLSTLGLTPSLLVDKEFILRKIPTEAVVMENVYFEFGKAELSTDSKPVIDQTLLKLMQQEPDVLIEIEAHTDSVGSDEDNLQLSQWRAESVLQYLVSKGIEASRLTAIGYGETRPVAPNSMPDGSDNSEGRQKNRRTVFRITGER